MNAKPFTILGIFTEQTELYGRIENVFVYVMGSQETDIYGAFF